ncbi:phosphoenolpyruvate synthase (plasmid) [Agrobacterium salinitolerans]|uniref:phosphoenolpyruvate synthase n=1 Tax=Agrobacterium salinitolerans TaxID=1183413 RepID=UPI001C2374B9|nr:phosphoenolpyruvate synthase [Agrobacterium salinitolerans]QXC53048.1 phosphoenolpyruvate synthase [Agrobacterium salinitolerans]
METGKRTVLWFEEIRREDVAKVGGKNSSIGEMIHALSGKGIDIPTGFATTAEAYRHYVDVNNLRHLIASHLTDWQDGRIGLAETGIAIRTLFLEGEFPKETATEIIASYGILSKRAGVDNVAVAVRSSATAEDLPDASFAGQQESFLNIQSEQGLLDACRRCYASLFTDRAIVYRQTKGFNHLSVALSIGVQQMVRSDLGGSGVMFSIDTETGFDKVVLINAAWGLGENVVQGAVDPDEYQVFKPLLQNIALRPIISKRCGTKEKKLVYGTGQQPTVNVPTSNEEQYSYVLEDDAILQLARSAVLIEQHYGCPMDIEWARDGKGGKLFIVQARPETVQSTRQTGTICSYLIKSKGVTLSRGLSIGDAVVAGRVCLVESPSDIERFIDGSVLVTSTTDPDWVPLMKRAAALVTDHGGRTSHAAIVSRELGLPAVVGTGNATGILRADQEVTVSCAEGAEGFVYQGVADYEVATLDVTTMPTTRTGIMLNLANPAAAYRWWRLPADGIGLARMEFVISNTIRIHPMALVRYDSLEDSAAKKEISELTRDYADKPGYFIDQLASGLASIAAPLYPKPVIVRLSDFKTNEYAHLIGGEEFEPKEENPMLGFRGASRYYSPRYREGFALECRAIRKLRNEIGFRNVVVMVPFCRSVEEARKVIGVMAENGLSRGMDELEIYIMCEIPSNVILAREFAKHFDGFSIGSNDLTQLTLGVDRDAGDLAELFNEQDPAIKWMIRHVISEAREAGVKVGICGQAPSDYPEFSAFLVECGIDSISVSPDRFAVVKQKVAEAELRSSKTS